MAANFSITFSTPSGAQAVSEGCLDAGSVCNVNGVPVGYYASGSTYEVFSGIGTNTIDIGVEACVGNPAITICKAVGASKCSDVTNPTTASNDGYAVADAHGLAHLSVSSAGLLYIGVTELNPVPPNPLSMLTHSYQIFVGKGVFAYMVMPPTLTVTNIEGSSLVSVSWSAVYGLHTSGKPPLSDEQLMIPPPTGSFAVANPEYLVFAVPTASIPAQGHPETSCGIHTAFFAAMLYNKTAVMPQFFFNNNTGLKQSFNLTVGVEYVIAVVARCGSHCGPSTVIGMMSSATPVYITAGKPASNKKPDSGLSPGATAGVVIVVLIVVFGGAAAAWWWYKKKQGDVSWAPVTAASSDYADADGADGYKKMDL